MDIKIFHLLEGAKKATGLTVVIDVFRAFSVEAYLFAGGAEKIIPVADINVAYEYKKNNPEFLLTGERDGKICPGFDFGNSPSQIAGARLDGKTVVHTTSAGTQGLFGAVNAQEVLGASLVNAAATAKFIKNSGYEDVSIVCMGLAGKEKTEEDTLCAEYIKAILEDREIDLIHETEKLKFTSGAKFFDREQSEVFPEDDFYLCTKADIFPFVLRLETDENGVKYMKRYGG